MSLPSFFNRLLAAYRRDPYPSYAYRLEGLKRLERNILLNQSQFVEALTKDFKKPAFETMGSEFLTVLVELRKAKKQLRKWMATIPVDTPTELFGTSSFMRCEPKGVVLILAPWNYPVNLTLIPLIAAWAAGNKIVVKPSEFSPHTSACIKKLVATCFSDDEVVVMEGERDVAEQLIALPFDHIFFTGSQEKASKLIQMTADRLIPVTLELGGKSPVIFEKGVDLNRHMQDVVFAKCLNAGQTCIGPDFVLIHKTQVETFRSLWHENLKKLYGENILENPEYCGIIHRKHFDRLVNMIKDSCMQGAQLDGELVCDEIQLKIKPILLLRSDWHHASMKEEIFGPVLPVIAYEDSDDWIASLHVMKVPLTLYLFSQRKQWLNEISHKVRSGGVSMNNCLLNYCNFNLPFGGLKESGIGFNHGKFGFEAFSHRRSFSVQRQSINTLRLFHPPYNPKKYRLMEWMIKMIGKI